MEMTARELVRKLSVFDPEARVMFGGPDALQFYRLKHRGRSPTTGAEMIQMEFNQQVYRDRRSVLTVEEPWKP